MKEKRNLLFSVILGIIIGWALGFLRIPFLEKNYSFWVGLVAGLAVVLFIIALLFVWNKNKLLMSLMGKNPLASDAEIISKTYLRIWTAVALFLILGGLVSSILIYRQNSLFESQAQYLNKKIGEQAISIKTIKNNNLVLLMSVFLDKVDAELKGNSNNSLSDARIAKIADLSHSFEPYSNFAGDGLSTNKLSHERGQLLLGLLKLKIDSVSFSKIKRSATFAGADLRKANLADADLNSVDLKEANLWGANLQRTNLEGADLNRVDLRWADLKEANLKSANLNGADLTNAKLIKTTLNGASLQWVELGETLLKEANFTSCDLLGANLMKVIFGKTNFTEVNLERANVEKDWLDKLTKKQIIGADKIQELYQIIPDRSRPNKLAKFRLKKIK